MGRIHSTIWILKRPAQKAGLFYCSLTTERQRIRRAVVQRPGQQPPKLLTGVRVSPALPRRGSQVGRHLPAKQTTSVRFRAAPPIVVSTGVRARLISVWSPRIRVHGRVRFSGPLPGFAPIVQRIGHHATNVEIGIRVLVGVPDFGRVRPTGTATSLLSWRHVGSNPTAPFMPGSSNGRMLPRLGRHQGSNPWPGTRFFPV